MGSLRGHLNTFVATVIFGLPSLAVIFFILIWLTSINEITVSGSAYGFEIGESKASAFTKLAPLNNKRTDFRVHVAYGSKPEERFTTSVSEPNFDSILAHDQWQLLLGGVGTFINTINLSFYESQLVEIHRIRTLIELP